MDYEIITFEVERKSSFPLCPAGTTGFHRLWENFFELCKLDALHHLNAHNVRYLCAKF
jgi:hypothetical protein